MNYNNIHHFLVGFSALKCHTLVKMMTDSAPSVLMSLTMRNVWMARRNITQNLSSSDGIGHSSCSCNSDDSKDMPPDFKIESPLDGQGYNLDAGSQNSLQNQNPSKEKEIEQFLLQYQVDPSSGRNHINLGNKNMDSDIPAPLIRNNQAGSRTEMKGLNAPRDDDSCSSNSNVFSQPENSSSASTCKPTVDQSNKNQDTGTQAHLIRNKLAGSTTEMKYLNDPQDDDSCSSNSNDFAYSDFSEKNSLNGQYPDADPESLNFLSDHKPSKKKFETEYHQGSASFGMSVLNLCNAIMGSGILGLSFAMANTGIALFVILLVSVAIFSLYSVHLLLKTANEAGALVYESLGYKAFGIPGKLAASCSISMLNIGAMSTYLYIIKYELSIVIQSFTGASDGEWYINGDYLVILVSIIVILPLSLLRNLGYLGYTSGLSLLCMVFFLIVVVIKKFQIPCPLQYFPDSGNETMHMFNSDNVTTDDDTCKPKYFIYNSQTVYAIPILTFAFVCHPTILPIYDELKDRSRRKMQNVANVSFLAMFIMYLLAALFGYLTFNIHVGPELLHTYSKFYKHDILLLVVRLAVLAAVTLTVPVVLFPIHTSVGHLLFPKKYFSWIRHVIITVSLLAGTNILVIFVPSIKDIFGFIGASAAVMLIFILPSAFYLRLVKKESMKSMQKIGALMFLILGFAVMFVCMTLIIYDWIVNSMKDQGH
ncbi:sodium-coupled neutral amino acid transporter 2-like isoform X3 [Xiphophorus maculatus]|uniref:sodium-coupled neutral amino acid transporter 2-like isoform X3 n=1 Tax=Xiphophorus maculatus TaxID=8083 RepID=UPI000C6D9306|nr:sodium-coupled neutral amino acid transporter 2-like isoform X3 [Xiphophorus maculatus]